MPPTRLCPLLLLLLLLPWLLLASPQATPTYKISYDVNPYPMRVDENAKYWPPGEGPPSKRWLEDFAAEYYRNQSMTQEDYGLCLRKMSADESEKFYDHYWSWKGDSSNEQGVRSEALVDTANVEPLNRSEAVLFRTPSRSHSYRSSSLLAIFRRASSSFICASGTVSCSGVGAPQVCCNTGQTCVKITDTGFGDVGCCNSGENCSGELTGCDSSTQISCSSSQGGGCCNKGQECSSNGCIAASSSPVATVVTTTSTAAKTCTPGSYACPTNVAGGCCPSGRLCGVTDCPSPPSTVEAATIAPGGSCPTGFYTCGASFNGGCCRVGRQCGVTTCPPQSSGSTVIVGGGTLTVTEGGTRIPNNGACANGWSTCAQSVGGGCCPNGYDCGTTNCPARTIVALQTAGGATILETTTLAATSKIAQGTFVAAAERGRKVDGMAAAAAAAVAGVGAFVVAL